MIFKLKKADLTKLAYFDAQPSWGDLASKIAELFRIESAEKVGVNFIDGTGDVVPLTNEQELQWFYSKHFGQSAGKIKFVVQDLQVPDSKTTIAATWSADSNLSDLSKADYEFRVFCWVLNVSDNPFSVDIGKGLTVDLLKEMIKKKKENAFRDIDANTLVLWKLSPAIPSSEIDTKVRPVQNPKEIPGCVKLDALDKLSEHFSSAPRKHLHIIVEALPKPSRKHPRSQSAEGDGEAKKKHRRRKWTDNGGIDNHEINALSRRRKWTVNGGIDNHEINGLYYVNPEAQAVTKLCLEAVSNGTYLLLAGARASGKSTRLFWLQQRLNSMGYCALYITFDGLDYLGSTKDFWKSFGAAIGTAVAEDGRGLHKGATSSMSSGADLNSYFRKDFWDGYVVLLLDEFSCLYLAGDNVRNDCLRTFRGLKHTRGHAVRCLIAAGTFDIVHLNPSNSRVSPFNITDLVQCPYFTIDETRKLFHEFAEDLGRSIDDGVIEDVWAKSNGHPGMVCLCGRTIFRNRHKLICPNTQTIPHNLWQQFPAEQLYSAISGYNTFDSMIESLSRPQASSSVNLLRSRFAGFLGDVTLTDEQAKKDADTLTSEGVLLKPDPAMACYRMASPLVDGLIRNKLIPTIFPNAPLSPLPRQHTGDIDVLGVLIESLKFFDKALILNASSCSYKQSKVKIPGPHGRHVPRESVYDTELMRILANWLRKNDWSVNSQWHLENNLKRHKYSDIVLEKGGYTVVLELLATGEPSSIQSHIRKTLEYSALLSANEAWVVHFTRQEDYAPIWQFDTSVNVVHFAHDPGFTNVVMSTRWKDCAGEIHVEVGRSLPLD